MENLELQQPKSYCTLNLNWVSLPLINNLNNLALITQRHISRVLLRTNRPRLSLILHERNPSPPRHQSHFLKTFEPAKYGRKTLHTVVFWKILNEEDLVRW